MGGGLQVGALERRFERDLPVLGQKVGLRREPGHEIPWTVEMKT